MKIVQPSFNIRTYTGKNLGQQEGIELLRFVEYMARISHGSEEKQTDTSYDRFLRAVVLEHGDWSVCEHAFFTVIFKVDRGVSHEIVRHRLFGFTQSSTRFINYEKKDGELEFIAPTDQPDAFEDGMWRAAMDQAESSYLSLLKRGWRPQEARSVLPNAFATVIACTSNLRNWRHFFLMRTTKETHPDFKAVTLPLLEELKKCIPILYDDIEPNARQIDNLRKGR